YALTRYTAAPMRSTQTTRAMTIRPESARSARRGDLTVRSWYRRHARSPGRANSPDRRERPLYRGPVRYPDVVASSLVSALPPGLVRALPAGAAVAAVRRGRSVVVGVELAELVVADDTEAFPALDALGPGFWVGWCAFELGHSAEKVTARGASLEPRTVPDL